jgi:hypothetical protein
MAFIPDEEKVKALGNDTRNDRRHFLKNAAAVGMLGAVEMIATGGDTIEAAQTDRIEDPTKPAGLRPLAQPDSRFPVTYEKSVPQAMALVTQYFAALSRRDLKAMSQTLQFPFATFEGTDAIVVQSVENLMDSPPPSMNVTGKGVNLIQPGAYDMLDSIELQIYNAVGAGLSLTYSRYGSDGHRILQSQGIYGITNNDGKWGIEYMSTIFKPAEQLSVVYNDGLEASLRQFRDWCLYLKTRDPDMLRNRITQTGQNVSCLIGEPLGMAHDARVGDPMKDYRIQGVKTRLHVSQGTAQSAPNLSFDVPKFADEAGGGVGKWGYSLDVPGWRAIHASDEKVHAYNGYIRYTGDGTVIDDTRILGIVTYRKSQWGSSGIFGEMMYHDRSNDARS